MQIQAYKSIFRPENGCSSKKRKCRNDQCQAHYQQTKFQKSDLSLYHIVIGCISFNRENTVDKEQENSPSPSVEQPGELVEQPGGPVEQPGGHVEQPGGLQLVDANAGEHLSKRQRKRMEKRQHWIDTKVLGPPKKTPYKIYNVDVFLLFYHY